MSFKNHPPPSWTTRSSSVETDGSSLPLDPHLPASLLCCVTAVSPVIGQQMSDMDTERQEADVSEVHRKCVEEGHCQVSGEDRRRRPEMSWAGVTNVSGSVNQNQIRQMICAPTLTHPSSTLSHANNPIMQCPMFNTISLTVDSAAVNALAIAC